jgi:hypothetical protein
MARGVLQFPIILPLPEFQQFYGTEKQCEAALDQARWLVPLSLLQWP